MGLAATRAALAALAAARVATGLHAVPYDDVAENLRAKNYTRVMKVTKLARQQDAEKDLPPDVQAQITAAEKALPDHVGELEQLNQWHHAKRHQEDQHLWLSGKSRQAMVNYADVQYIGYFEVGNQTLMGIVDTGSFELLVFSKACQECGQAGSAYHSDRSVNYRGGTLKNNHSYGSGDTSSQEAYDMVSIGPYEPKIQFFWEVIGADMPVLKNSAFNAIIGVGPPEMPVAIAEDKLRRLKDNITSMRQKHMDVPHQMTLDVQSTAALSREMKSFTQMLDNFETKMFSVCIGRVPQSDGYVIWSDTAPLVKPEFFKTVPVVGNHTWSALLTSPKLRFEGGKQMNPELEGASLGCEDGCGALLDSGTSLLAMPSDVINKIIEVMQTETFNCTNLWELPAIHFKLGDQEFSLPPDVYVMEAFSHVPKYLRYRGDDEYRGNGEYLRSSVRLRQFRVQKAKHECMLLIMESTVRTANKGPLWIMGLPFFRKYYTTFELGGHDGQSRNMHISKATDSCFPSASEDTVFPPRSELHRRTIDPEKLWVSSSSLRMISSDVVSL